MPGCGCGVGDQGQREPSSAQPVQGRDRTGQRSPRDGQHAVDVDQHRADGPHAPLITESPRQPKTPAVASRPGLKPAVASPPATLPAARSQDTRHAAPIRATIVKRAHEADPVTTRAAASSSRRRWAKAHRTGEGDWGQRRYPPQHHQAASPGPAARRRRSPGRVDPPACRKARHQQAQIMALIATASPAARPRQSAAARPRGPAR